MFKKKGKSITSFHDLEVYQNSYHACIEMMTKIIPNLPDSEKFDLKKQLSSSVKAIPRLIAEGLLKDTRSMDSKNIWMMPWLNVMKPLLG